MQCRLLTCRYDAEAWERASARATPERGRNICVSFGCVVWVLNVAAGGWVLSTCSSEWNILGALFVVPALLDVARRVACARWCDVVAKVCFASCGLAKVAVGVWVASAVDVWVADTPTTEDATYEASPSVPWFYDAERSARVATHVTFATILFASGLGDAATGKLRTAQAETEAWV